MKAVSNPTRVDILSYLLGNGPSSPSKIARRLDHVSVNLVSHHIKVLRELGCVELVDEVKHGGRTERIYRAKKRVCFSSAEAAAMDDDEVYAISFDVIRLISEDLEAALLAKSLHAISDGHLSRIPVRLDKEGWEEIVSMLDRMLDKVERVGERSVERSRASGEDLIDVRVALLQFPMPEKKG
ncbi:MAG: winged helix-turn-helix domain-containing protein [Solirubrobacterales bacterium]